MNIFSPKWKEISSIYIDKRWIYIKYIFTLYYVGTFVLYIKSKQVVFASVVSSRHLALREQRERKQGNVALTYPLNISVFVCF